MKSLTVLLILLLATTAGAQQLIYVAPQQPAPSTPAYVVPQLSIDGPMTVPLSPLLPQTAVVTDNKGNRFRYQETSPGAGSYWVFPLQSD